jgi:mRNA interferase MazF
MTAYNFGDVVLVGFPHTDLRDVSKRPAFVIYDADDLDILVARITTQEYNTGADYKIVEWRRSGLIAESFVRLSKQATIEKKCPEIGVHYSTFPRCASISRRWEGSWTL